MSASIFRMSISSFMLVLWLAWVSPATSALSSVSSLACEASEAWRVAPGAALPWTMALRYWGSHPSTADSATSVDGCGRPVAWMTLLMVFTDSPDSLATLLMGHLSSAMRALTVWPAEARR